MSPPLRSFRSARQKVMSRAPEFNKGMKWDWSEDVALARKDVTVPDVTCLFFPPIFSTLLIYSTPLADSLDTNVTLLQNSSRFGALQRTMRTWILAH